MKNIILTLSFPFLLLYDSFAQNVGNFIKYQKQGTDLLVEGTAGSLLIQAYTPDIFKIQVLKPGQSRFDSSYAVVIQPRETIGSIDESPEQLRVPFAKCQLVITKKPLQVALTDGSRQKIKWTSGFQQVRDSIAFTFEINPKDVVHGTGTRPYDMDLNGKAFDFYNTWRYAYFDDIYGLTFGSSQSLNVPFFVSSHQYGLFLDTNKPGVLRTFFGGEEADSTKLRGEIFSQGRWSFYLINGNTNDDILNGYTLLTGKQPLPPRWCLGYIQSKFGYENEQQARNVVDRLRTTNFPLDAIVMDLFWYGNFDTMGNIDWDSSKWPQPERMMSDFATRGIKTILITDPYVSEKSKNFRRADSLRILATFNTGTTSHIYNVFGTRSGLIDIFNPKAQDFLWQNYKRLTRQGVGGWWTDKIEPDNQPKGIKFSAGDGIQVHNLYPFIWQQNLYENFKKDFPDQRLFNLTRTGYAGSQRFSSMPWTGDVARAWSGLKLQIPMMLHAGMTGFGYTHSDTGGFSTYGNEERDDELDLRWVQFSVFAPIVRTHGWRLSTEPYNLKEPFQGIYRKYLRLRYQLLPYLYTLSWLNTTVGRPLCMPIDYFEPSKINGNINDEYLFGENLLVAPIYLHGLPVRKVVLPKGKWFNFWTNEAHDGSKTIFDNVTLDNIPVYAKAGGIVPLATSWKNNTEQYTNDSLTVKFFQDISVRNSSFSMYHDDGKDPKAIENQQFEIIDFLGKTYTDSVVFESVRKNTFAKGLANRAIALEIINVANYPRGVRINNRAIQLVTKAEDFRGTDIAYYSFDERVVRVRYAWNCAVPAKVVLQRDGTAAPTSSEPKLLSNDDLVIYPSPVARQGLVNVQTPIVESGVYQITVFDTNGKIVYEQNLGKIQQGQSLSHSFGVGDSVGTLLINIQNEKGSTMSGKFLVK